MGEMQAARDAGLTWVVGWTCTFSYYDDYYYYNVYYYYDNDHQCFDDYYYGGSYQTSVCPMRKE